MSAELLRLVSWFSYISFISRGIEFTGELVFQTLSSEVVFIEVTQQRVLHNELRDDHHTLCSSRSDHGECVKSARCRVSPRIYVYVRLCKRMLCFDSSAGWICHSAGWTELCVPRANANPFWFPSQHTFISQGLTTLDAFILLQRVSMLLPLLYRRVCNNGATSTSKQIAQASAASNT